MKALVIILLVGVGLLAGCASNLVELRGYTDFNPIYEWNPTMKIFVLPDNDSEVPISYYRIETKLSRILRLAGDKAGINVVEDPEQADGFMFVKYRMDTISYITPASSFTYGNSTLWHNRLTKQLGTVSYDWTVTMPSIESQRKFITVELWLMENPLVAEIDSGETAIHMVSYATSELIDDDHNRLTYDLLVACLKSIPEVQRNFETSFPIIEAVLEMNWLSGVKTRNVDIQGTYIDPPKPFSWDDIIYEINGIRIFDYFDYKAAMISMPKTSKSCRVKINRRGKQIELDYRL